MLNLPQIMSETFKRKVSYSQFSNWFNCPHHWYLDSVKGLKIYDDSINTCFGTAIHESIQLYIETLYKQSAAAADLHDLKNHFRMGFEKELVTKKVEVTEIQKTEFMEDGNEIINSFSNITNRIKYFPSNKYEFIGVEDEIIMPIKNNVNFICYIDVILKEKSTGRYRIIDIKTSTRGWNHYQKEDPSKISQILLYKAFFSKKYNVPLNMIDVEFFILKRKLFENTGFPQSRIQYFVPTHNEKNVKTTLTTFSQFVGECFKPDGSYIDDVTSYPKIPGKAKKNCKYCPHRKINCDMKPDIMED
jgi:hypothetical protein